MYQRRMTTYKPNLLYKKYDDKVSCKYKMDQINVFYKDFETICRLCLSTEKLNSIFAAPESIATFKYVTKIQVKETDKLPKNICMNCSQTMENIASFIRTCKNSDAILKAVVFQQEDKSLAPPEPGSINPKLTTVPVEEILIRVNDEGKNKGNIITLKIVKEAESNRATANENDKIASRECGLINTKLENEPVEEILVQVEGDEKEDNLITFEIVKEKTEPNLEENENKIGRRCLRNNKIFSCKQCNKKFSRPTHLRSHIYSHKKCNNGLICDKCNKLFLTDAALERHTCLVPKTRFKCANEKKAEIRKKRNEMCLCVHCNKYLTRRSDLQRHLRTHAGIKLFTCEVCGKKLSQKSALIRHGFLHSEKFKCDVCGKRYTRESELRDHLEKGHNVKNDTNSCSFCAKIFKSKSYLRLHMKLHTGQADFRCDICQKVFVARISLDRHYLSHTGVKEFKCDECDAEFNMKSLLNRHKKSHEEDSEEKSKLTCADCGKYFLAPSLLQRHRLVHNPNKTKQPKPPLTTVRASQGFLCSYCGKKYSYMCNLKVHLKTHTGVHYTCEICQKSYSKQESLKQHLLAHKGEKPYPCPYCGKQFRKPSYYMHLLIHKGEKRFQCEVCKKGFIRKDQLKQHLRVHKL